MRFTVQRPREAAISLIERSFWPRGEAERGIPEGLERFR